MQIDLNELNKVWEVKPLKTTGVNEARKILENVATQVLPIMRNRKLKVRTLSEFRYTNAHVFYLTLVLLTLFF